MLTLSPDYSFVVEDEQGVCGYLAATLHAKSFWQKYEVAYLPEMREKYVKPEQTDDKDINEAEVAKLFYLLDCKQTYLVVRCIATLKVLKNSRSSVDNSHSQ